jgi:hypothetical protein
VPGTAITVAGIDAGGDLSAIAIFETRRIDSFSVAVLSNE